MFTSRMPLALDQARAAAERGESPIGAVLTAPDGTVIAADGNRVRELADPTAHAEMLVIRAAARALSSERLTGCGLTVTLEPCPMCAGAISLARIAQLWYGAPDPKGGHSFECHADRSIWRHRYRAAGHHLGHFFLRAGFFGHFEE